jgi:hypothetical protein
MSGSELQLQYLLGRKLIHVSMLKDSIGQNRVCTYVCMPYLVYNYPCTRVGAKLRVFCVQGDNTSQSHVMLHAQSISLVDIRHRLNTKLHQWIWSELSGSS